VPAARGTVFRYGSDGVCHQLANQTLFATGRGGSPPLMVRHARGYPTSSFLYGDYGLQTSAWQRRIARCARARPSAAKPTAVLKASLDDFEYRARAVLFRADDLSVLKKLLNLRLSAQRELRLKPKARTKVRVTAQELNERNQK